MLVVEDNLLNRGLLCQMLAQDYHVLEAENGEQALEKIHEYGPEKISLILLDIIMPVMDGYTFLTVIKDDPACASIPVIVTTQNDAESDEVTALAKGATDFVAKPYKPQVIRHRVASIINLRETAAVINAVQYDHLTGVYSKEFFYRRAREEILANPGVKYDVICSDIENFKLVNDVFGNATGDRLLKMLAQLSSAQIAGNGLCGRLGSDQFAFLIHQRNDYQAEMFRVVADQLSARMKLRNIAIKWGIYHINDTSVTFEQVCDRALLAARSIKGQYGKVFNYYDDELRARLLKEQAITDNMETALAENQFQIYLQPKYRIEDERMIGAEALVRWIHPEWGFQSPAEFIPLFERNGFITKLDQYVWERACATLHDWDQQGLPPIAVSVNVSRADIYNTDLPALLTNLVEKYALSPSRLSLEITESAYTESPKQIIDAVAKLRNLGFTIEMDDFGSGYSSLNMLNEMPIDILKLDMKFIQAETSQRHNRGVLRFIIDLARWMNLGVVAEGVETKEQLLCLKAIGCDYVQGYYFSRPLPQAEFEQLLKSQGAVSVDEVYRTKEGKNDNPVILIATQDDAYLQAARENMQGWYEIVGKASSKDTLHYLQTHKNTGALVLDLQLPGGVELLKKLTTEREYWSLPVIAMYPPDPDMEDLALSLGAEDFITIPHHSQSLVRRLQRIRRKQTQLGTPIQRGKNPPDPEAPAAPVKN